MAEMVRAPEPPIGEWILIEEEIMGLTGETAAPRGGVGEFPMGEGLVGVLPYKQTHTHTQKKTQHTCKHIIYANKEYTNASFS